MQNQTEREREQIKELTAIFANKLQIRQNTEDQYARALLKVFNSAGIDPYDKTVTLNKKR